MKSLLLVVLFFCSSIIPIKAQFKSAVSIGSRYVLNDNWVVVYPFMSKQNILLGTSKIDRQNPVKLENIDKWLRLFNKENKTDYIAAEYSLRPDHILLVDRKYADKQEQADIDFQLIEQKELPQVYDQLIIPFGNDGDIVYREGLFKKSKRFKKKLQIGSQVKNFTGIENVSVYTHVNYLPDTLLSGKSAVRFVDSSSGTTMAQYYGEMKKGLPDGYGMYAKRDSSSYNGYVRQGFWKEGQFIEETEAFRRASFICKNILSNKVVKDLKISIPEILYGRDIILKNVGNDYNYVIRYDWNDGKNDHNVIFSYYGSDFYNPPTLTWLSGDPAETFEIFKKDDWAVIGDFLNQLKTGIRTYMNNEHKYDDYLRINDGPYLECNGEGHAYTKTAPNYNPNSNETRTETNYYYTYDYCASILLDVRTKRSDKWQPIGEISVTKVNEGTARRWASKPMVVTDFMGHRFTKASYASIKDIIDEIVPIIKKKYPDPKNDTTKEIKVLTKEDAFAAAKIDSLIKRVIKLRPLSFDPKDSIAGVWVNKDQRVFFVHRKDSDIDYSVGTSNLKPDRNYTGKYFVLDGYYARKGNVLEFSCFFESSQSIKVASKDVIKELKPNYIIFDDGDIWKRIQ